MGGRLVDNRGFGRTMMSMVPYIALFIFAGFYLYTGLLSMLSPRKFARGLSLEPVGRSGLIEVQAQYGGFFVVAGLFQIFGLLNYVSPVSALTVALVIFSGLIVGRVAGWFLGSGTGEVTPMIRSLFIVDAVGAALAIFAICTIN